MITSHTVGCPHCGGPLEFDAADDGATAACPHCTNDVILTTADPEPPVARATVRPGRLIQVESAQFRSEDSYQWGKCCELIGGLSAVTGVIVMAGGTGAGGVAVVGGILVFAVGRFLEA